MKFAAVQQAGEKTTGRPVEELRAPPRQVSQWQRWMLEALARLDRSDQKPSTGTGTRVPPRHSLPGGHWRHTKSTSGAGGDDAHDDDHDRGRRDDGSDR